MPRFSIIVPTFNRAHLLPRCIDSVLKQMLRDFEVVVADDGSTDGTRRLVEQYVAHDARVRYVSQENRGAGNARNLGASVADGQYLLFLDSDDEVSPQWLQRLHEPIDEQRADVVCCGCRFVDEGGNQWHVRKPGPEDATPVFKRGFFFTGTFAIRKHVFELLGGYASGLPANQHSELRLRLLPACEENNWILACVDEPLVTRYSHLGPNIRGNVQAIYDSGTYILSHHGHVLKAAPDSFAAWAAAVGGSAAKLGNYGEARSWFLTAALHAPWYWKNYARLAAIVLPALRRRVWKARGPGELPPQGRLTNL